MITTPYMGLQAWTLDSDTFDPAVLAQDLETIDAHNHTQGQGAQVPTGGLQDAAVTTAKIATGAVGSAQIANGAVGSAQLSPSLVTGFIPAGAIFPYGGSTAPAGFLMADGSQANRFTYASLFSVLGTNYGAGDGSSTFNLPNLTQRFPLGLGASGTGATLGETGGQLDHIHGVTIPALSFAIPSLPVAISPLSVSVAIPSHSHALNAFEAAAALNIQYNANTGAVDGDYGEFSPSNTTPAIEMFYGGSAPTFESHNASYAFMQPQDASLLSSHGAANWPGTGPLTGIGLIGTTDVWGSTVSTSTSAGSGTTSSTTATSASTGVTSSTNNPPYVTVTYLIKY